jgi:hypothetical protein
MKSINQLKRYWRSSSAVGGIFAGLLTVLPLHAGTGKNPVRLLQNSPTGCTVEFRLTGFSLDTVRLDSRQYLKTGFDGSMHATIPGDPQVPYAVAVIGLPPDGDVRVSLAASEPGRTLEGIRLCPVPRIDRQEDFPVEIFSEGEAYGKQTSIPGSIFDAGEPEWFGPFRVVRLRIHPIQYNPAAGSLQVLSRVVLSVTFSGKTVATAAMQTSADEAVYRGALLNYSTARQWRVRNPQPAGKKSRSFDAGLHYKIPISTEGMYQVTGSFLASSGIDISAIDPSTLKIYNNGGEPLPSKLTDSRPDSLIENPIQTVGMDDNRFDPSDYFVFYGKGPAGIHYTAKQFSHYVNPFVTENIYWLVFNDGRKGRRIQRSSPPGGSGGQPAEWFTDLAYFQHDIENPIKAGMFWDSHTFEPNNPDWTLDLPVFDPVADSTAYFLIQVKGGTDAAGVLDVSVNDNPLSAISLFAASKLSYNKIYPSGLSSSGNKISFHFRPSTLAAAAHLGWIEIQYKRKLQARNGGLRFFSPLNAGFYECRLSGFSQEPTVWDVSVPSGIRSIPVVRDNAGYLMTDAFDPGLPRTYLARTGFDTPASIQKAEWNNLRDPGTEGELLIITHADFYEQASRYKQFKENFDSLTVFLADVQDVYDNFSGGLLDPAGIRDFVKYAFDRWRKPPAYLLLVGDGHYDYRMLSPDAGAVKIPPYEVDALRKDDARAMDDYYTYVSSPDQGALSSGRLTVQTAEEAETVFGKLIDYQSNPDRGDWRSLITMVADDAFHAGKDNETEHTAASEYLAEEIFPRSFNIRKIYMTEYPVEIRTRRLKPGAENDLVNQINQGTLIINYTGHANRTVWADEWVFQHKTDMNRLHNGARLPLFYTATCEFGLYDDPSQQHFAEDLLASPDKGGIAIIGATRFCQPNYNEDLNREFMNALLNEPGTRYRIGDAFRIAKLRTTDSGRANDEQYHILGDPSMRLAVPRRQVVFTRMEPDSFKALGLVRVTGEVSENGSVSEGFDGNVLLRAFDSKKPTRYLTDEKYPSTISYLLPGNPLFRGEGKVQSGRFEVQFIVPKDISYGGDLGRLSGYVWNENTDGFGYRDSVATGGSASIDDQRGPDIRLSFGQREGFVSGDMVSEDPELDVIFEDDKSGINLTGEIGHKITLTLDDRAPVDISEYFQYDQGSFLKGRIAYKMSGTSQGDHQLTVKAWDNANNSSSQAVEFRVVTAGALVLEKVINYPNPMSDGTAFTFEINEAAEVEIKIFTVDGRRIGRIDRFLAQPGFNMASWDGRDESGDGLSNGVYLYKVTARNRLRGKDVETSVIGKLIVMR